MGTVVCGSSDAACKNTFYQSRCGRLMQIQASSAVDAETETDASVVKDLHIGLFKRNEIYWRQGCDSDYRAVRENNAPLQNALLAQLCLLAINTIMNCITVFVAITVLMVYIFNIDLPCIPGDAQHDVDVLKLLNQRVSLSAKILKLVPCITAVVYLS